MAIKIALLFFIFSSTAIATHRVDSHVHAFSLKPKQTKDYLLAAKKNGFSKSFLLSAGYAASVKHLLDPQYKGMEETQFIKTENDYIASLQSKYPDKVAGFCSVPWKYRHAEREIKRCATQLKLKGLKVYPSNFHKSPAGFEGSRYADISSNARDNEHMRLLIELAHKYDLVMGIHSSSFTANNTFTFLVQSNFRLYKDNLRVIFFHGFTFHPFKSFNFFNQIARNWNAKIFIELSDSFTFYAEGTYMGDLWRKALSEVDTSKILFGSDYFGGDAKKKHDNEIANYLSLFDEDTLYKIMVENPKALKLD